VTKPKSHAASETIAIEALTFLVADPERLGRFLALSGLDGADIRKAAESPDFLTAVMQHLMEDEQRLVDFAAEAHLKPEAVASAARRLGAGAWERDIP
jgi:N-acetylglucosamine kinase-like BadF-type ATPase